MRTCGDWEVVDRRFCRVDGDGEGQGGGVDGGREVEGRDVGVVEVFGGFVGVFE